MNLADRLCNLREEHRRLVALVPANTPAITPKTSMAGEMAWLETENKRLAGIVTASHGTERTTAEMVENINRMVEDGKKIPLFEAPPPKKPAALVAKEAEEQEMYAWFKSLKHPERLNYYRDNAKVLDKMIARENEQARNKPPYYVGANCINGKIIGKE